MALQVVNADSVGTGVRINLGTDDDVHVAAGVVVGSTDGDICIWGTGVGQVVHVEGQLVSNNFGILLGTGGATADTETYLDIHSVVRSFGNTGVALFGGGHEIELHGRVFAKSYGLELVDGTAAKSLIVNDGLISARDVGVYLDTTDQVTIENFGTIAGDAVGIYVNSNSGGIRIVNSGTIKGGDGIINDSVAAMVIENTGLIRLGAQLGTEDDTYDGSLGRITGDILAGTGNDDVIGGAGTERIIGQAGADTLTGGGGRDQFIYEAAGDSTTTSNGRDLITDFSQKDGDFLDLSILGVDELDFVGKKHFTEADQIRYITKGGTTTVFINLDTVADSEMSIRLTGKIHLTDGDFAL